MSDVTANASPASSNSSGIAPTASSGPSSPSSSPLVGVIATPSQPTPAGPRPAGDLPWSTLIPVATLVLGFLLKWLQDWSMERRKERGQERLRRELRADALLERRIEIERSNLLALQPVLSSLAIVVAEFHHARQIRFGNTGTWSTGGLPQGLYDNRREAYERLLPIRARLHTIDIMFRLDELTDLGQACNDATSPQDAIVALADHAECVKLLHGVVGTKIRELEFQLLDMVRRGQSA